jgi:hypothetical protein
MQAIVTKYLGPTNTRGARVKATAQRGSVTVPWDYALDAPGNHRVACMAALVEWEWKGEWTGGQLPDGRYAFVCIPPRVAPGYTPEAAAYEWNTRPTRVLPL